MSVYNSDSGLFTPDSEMTMNEIMLTSTSGTALPTIPESPCEEESDFDFDEPEMMNAFFNATATSSTARSKTTPTTAKSHHRLSLNLAFLSPNTANRPDNNSNKLSASCTTGVSSPMSSSPPSATYSCPSFASSTASSVASSPGGVMGGACACSPAALSPILNPFQWTTDLRQYIITDIGPQPSNSRQIPTLVRSHVQQQKEQSQQAQSPLSPSPSHQMQRQRSNSRIQAVAITTLAANSALGSGMSSSFSNFKALDGDHCLDEEVEDEHDSSFSSGGFYGRKFGVGMMDRFPMLTSKEVGSTMSETAIEDSDMTVDQEFSS
ncbi:hypothetical protein EMPS_07370 [Entomortierella parvispora]|uniref:Uncharacterized protein n=1 Tax=Entomortierella parvispora TaxID=205924 RepID=A0A9P3HE85_9FUNG|nr:hypothetical protein EMPS_07370 [Entomortierella parvispora]